MILSLLLEPEKENREEGESKEDGLAYLQSKDSGIVNRKERGEAEGQTSLIGMKRNDNTRSSIFFTASSIFIKFRVKPWIFK